ncbi:MAG: biopolymer transporter ExbD [Capsulimonadaceae bacterium]|nr:biopolymer transporter ExbD [Capsulimonadaceae bacterium]
MAEINVVPLVDVTLVLLIIFMVTTAFITAPAKPQGNREIDVTLPAATFSAAAAPAPNILVLGIDAKGQRYVDGQPVTADQMIERVKTAAAQNVNRRVRIDGDQDTHFQKVVELLEICQFVGLRNVGVHVRDQKQVQ